MNAFIVHLEDKPGELTRVAEAIARKGIDITSFAGLTCGRDGTVAFVTNDEAGTRKALSEAGCEVREAELIPASIPNSPGELAKIARKLSDAGVNVEAALPTGMSGGTATVAFATSDPVRARQLLGSKESIGVGTR